MLPDAATRPMPREQALRIARAFLPERPWGNRHDYYYTRIKLRTDPLYPGVLHALAGTHAPVLDLGCGLGLLAHALRAGGMSLPYHGVDIDADKIRRAPLIAARAGVEDVRFEVMDLGRQWPQHAGSVCILDVLQYLEASQRSAMLRHMAAMLTPGARLVIRSGLGDANPRGRTTRVTDLLAHLTGWMQEVPRSYPTRASLQADLQAAGLQAEFMPLYGKTPFNNWLVVAQKA